jgi:dTDP-glucose pyrophosphorylase
MRLGDTSVINISEFLVSQPSTVGDTIRCMNTNTRGIAILVDDDNRFVGVITDGDIRRAFLVGVTVDTPIQAVLDLKAGEGKRSGISAPIETGIGTRSLLMSRHGARQLPLVDTQGIVVGIEFEEQARQATLADYSSVTAVIMAGGRGERLRPLTDSVPKPMLPVNGTPVLEIIVGRMRDSGIERVVISTHYRAEYITEYFGNGSDHGVDISYIHEDKPLGTAGCLSKLTSPSDSVVVVNGDILTDVRYNVLLEYHKNHKADMTIGLNIEKVSVPYGLVTLDGMSVQSIEEKPTITLLTNAGIYVIESNILGMIPSDREYGMDTLINLVIDTDKNIVGFPIHENWIDIGTPVNYRDAQAFDS